MAARKTALAVLRSEWRSWRHPGRYLHPDFRMVCPSKCGECEACAMTAFRADRLAELAAVAATVKES